MPRPPELAVLARRFIAQDRQDLRDLEDLLTAEPMPDFDATKSEVVVSGFAELVKEFRARRRAVPR